MKPLTIEELKALPVGDWVWVVFADGIFEPRKGYFQKTKETNGSIFFDGRYVKKFFDYSDYGTKWTAYKNKEQAECKGEMVELPCIRKSARTIPKYEVVYINEYDAITVERHEDEKNAKAKLAELKGEK